MSVESVYPAGLRPPVDVLGLHQTLVLGVADQIRQQELLLVMELVGAESVHGSVSARNDDVGPIAAADVNSAAGRFVQSEVVLNGKWK